MTLGSLYSPNKLQEVLQPRHRGLNQARPYILSSISDSFLEQTPS